MIVQVTFLAATKLPPHFRLFNFSFLINSMITRYSRPEMRAIWTDENKLNNS